MKRLKLFAGIGLTPSVRMACNAVTERLRGAGLNARFEPAEKLHVTLAFLGWVDPESVEPIRDALARAARDVSPFDLTLDRVGAFPHERKPRVVWIGSRGESAPFRTLAQKVRSAYEPLGFSFEKTAVAHVTIARVKGGDAALPLLEIAPIRMRVGALTLFESLPAGRTTRYEVRARTPLKSQA